MTVSGVCKRCKEKIEWKIRYGKYKPLTVPKCCTVCHEKVVKFAYHTMCTNCSTERGVCSKCGQRSETVVEHCDLPADRAREEAQFCQASKDMREREKRALIRQLEKKQVSEVKHQTSHQTKDSKTSSPDDLWGIGNEDASDVSDIDELVTDRALEANEITSECLYAEIKADNGDNSI